MGFFKSLFGGGSKKDETPQSDNKQENLNSQESSVKEEEPQKQESQQKKESDFDVLKYDGIRAAAMGRREYAIACFLEALERKQDYETYGLLAQTYGEIGKLKEAVSPLEKMVEMRPEIVHPRLILANLYFSMEDFPKMKEWAMRAIECDKENEYAFLALAKSQFALSQIKEGIASLDRAIEINDKFSEAVLMRAVVHREQREFQPALQLIEKLMSNEEGNIESALLEKACILNLMGKDGEAETIYRGIIENNPFEPVSYLCLSGILLNRGDTKGALDTLNEAIDMKPDLLDAIALRRAIHEKIGDTESAKEDERLLKEALGDGAQIPVYQVK